jgi:putative ABC transport system substrate-binding protein
MKKILPLMLFLFFCRISPVAASGLLVIQSLPIKPYNEALRGFKSVCTGKTSKLASSELSEAEIVKKSRIMNPSLILAIGMDALAKARTIRNVPVIYLMVLNPRSLIQDSENITGISMYVQPGRQLSTLQQILPQARKIGLLFDPDKSGFFVKSAQTAAAATNIELLTKAVHSTRDAVAAFDGMNSQIDALWLLPVTTVVNPGSIDLLLLSAMEFRIPVFCFSEKYVEKGALFSLDVDALEAGKQAGEMANRILAGEAVQKIGKADARGSILTINRIVAKKLSIRLNSDLLKHASTIQIGNK